MVRHKNIIWDWNGTLLDDTELCMDIMNEQLVAIGKETLTLQRYTDTFDFPVRRFYEKIGFDFSKQSYETFAQTFISQYGKRRFACSVHRGSRQLLQSVIDRGGCNCLLSAYEESQLLLMISHFDLHPLFSHIVGLDNHFAAGKLVQGQSLFTRLKDSGAERQSMILVGDTVHDFAVASALGIDCILVAHGHHSRNKLLACGCPVVGNLQEAEYLLLD
ncbi:MAG: HAD family hydrolase [Chitinivibrionales bacterium]|nr:HAD family hydrolase [Chitinivibrionales bacterium]